MPEASSSIAAPRSLARGAEVGRYTILGSVGRGRGSEVFAAFDPKLNRRIALKLLHADDPTLPARGDRLREAQAMARLLHPNVIKVHDAGTFGDRAFVAMEFIDGVTLPQWLAQRPRAPGETVAVFAAAARGLAAA